MIGSLPLNAPQLEGRIIPALDAVEARLLEVVSNADETINPPTSHLAEAGGKRLRPVLTLLTAQLGDTALATGEQVRDAGVAVELTHIGHALPRRRHGTRPRCAAALPAPRRCGATPRRS